ncbi:MAG: UDP-N-acetylglucosamine 2-epimerase (non-hydrolyzing) [Pseudomonadota bacterium]
MSSSSLATLRVACFTGTRPECLKLASLSMEAQQDPRFDLQLVSSGQHPVMVAETLAHLAVPLGAELTPIPAGTPLSRSVDHLRRHARQWLHANRPDIVLVQGDTSTAYACALAAVDCNLPLAHLEAGLRTHDPMRPFPEEPFRRRIAPLARWNFAPTSGTATHLRNEGMASDSIHVVGNSIADLLRLTLESPCGHDIPWREHGKRLVIMTLHRRENYQHGLVNVCTTLLELLALEPDLCLVCPMHPNPLVRTQLQRLLGGHARILTVPPVLYRNFIPLLQEAALVVTDSGGIQEEAAYIGSPVLVTRAETERPEAAQNGTVQLIGTDPVRLLQACREQLQAARPKPCGFDAAAPFGDGHTARRVLAALWASRESLP